MRSVFPLFSLSYQCCTSDWISHTFFSLHRLLNTHTHTHRMRWTGSGLRARLLHLFNPETRASRTHSNYCWRDWFDCSSCQHWETPPYTHFCSSDLRAACWNLQTPYTHFCSSDKHYIWSEGSVEKSTDTIHTLLQLWQTLHLIWEQRGEIYRHHTHASAALTNTTSDLRAAWRNLQTPYTRFCSSDKHYIWSESSVEKSTDTIHTLLQLWQTLHLIWEQRGEIYRHHTHTSAAQTNTTSDLRAAWRNLQTPYTHFCSSDKHYIWSESSVLKSTDTIHTLLQLRQTLHLIWEQRGEIYRHHTHTSAALTNTTSDLSAAWRNLQTPYTHFCSSDKHYIWSESSVLKSTDTIHTLLQLRQTLHLIWEQRGEIYRHHTHTSAALTNTTSDLRAACWNLQTPYTHFCSSDKHYIWSESSVEKSTDTIHTLLQLWQTLHLIWEQRGEIYRHHTHTSAALTNTTSDLRAAWRNLQTPYTHFCSSDKHYIWSESSVLKSTDTIHTLLQLRQTLHLIWEQRGEIYRHHTHTSAALTNTTSDLRAAWRNLQTPYTHFCSSDKHYIWSECSVLKSTDTIHTLLQLRQTLHLIWEQCGEIYRRLFVPQDKNINKVTVTFYITILTFILAIVSLYLTILRFCLAILRT